MSVFFDRFITIFVAVGEDGGAGAGGVGCHRVHAHRDVVKLLDGFELGRGLDNCLGARFAWLCRFRFGGFCSSRCTGWSASFGWGVGPHLRRGWCPKSEQGGQQSVTF